MYIFTLQLLSLPNYFSSFPLLFEITSAFLKRFLIYYFKACLLNDTLTSVTNIRLNVWMIMVDNKMARI